MTTREPDLSGGHDLVGIGTHRFDPLDDTDAVSPVDQAGRAATPTGDDGDRSVWLVQLHRRLPVEEMDRLRRDYDLDLTRYLPERAYIERVPASVRSRLAADPVIRAVAPYRPEYRLSPDLAARQRARAVRSDGATTPVALTYALLLLDDASPESVVGPLESLGATGIVVLDDRPIGGSAQLRFRAPDGWPLDRIAALPDVQWIEPMGASVEPAVASNQEVAAIHQSGATDATPIWAQHLTGTDQVVAVMDTDMARDGHPILLGDDPSRPKVVYVRPGPERISQHALSVAGVLAGKFPPGHPLADPLQHGGAPDARLALFSSRLMLSSQSTTYAELTTAAGRNAFIHNNSWIMGRYLLDANGDIVVDDNGNEVVRFEAYDLICRDFDLFIHKREQHLVVAAMPNTGDTAAMGPPHLAKNPLTVAATKSPQQPRLFGSGRAGVTLDGRRRPDLAAVGGGMKKAEMEDVSPEEAAEPDWQPALVDVVGAHCSYATPHVSAAAALIRQYFTEGWYPTGIRGTGAKNPPSGALLKAILVASTQRTNSPHRADPLGQTGWGLVQLDEVLFFAANAPTRRLQVFDVPHSKGATTDSPGSHTITVPQAAQPGARAGQPLRVVLAYFDRPGTPGAASSVVNNLNLKLTDPTGTIVYHGNDFTPDGDSRGVDPNVEGNTDLVNNVEMIHIPEAAPGEWRVEVTGTVNVASDLGPSLPQGAGTLPSKQGYALAVVGDVTVPNPAGNSGCLGWLFGG